MVKHMEEYEALKALAVDDDMNADAFGVVTGADGEQTTTPRCVVFEGEVKDGDKVLETHYGEIGNWTWEDGFWIDRKKEQQRGFHIVGWALLQPDGGDLIQENSGKRFEEEISGWTVLSPEKPENRDIEFEVIGGGVGDTFIRWNIKRSDSGHGQKKDTRCHVMVWGQ